MTGLLVSVRDAREAGLAIEAGVDVLDVKDPSRGSLGAADRATIAQIAALAAARVPLSVALGELIELRDAPPLHKVPRRSEAPPEHALRQAEPSLAADLPAGVRYAKLGLAGCAGLDDWESRWEAWAAGLPQGISPVAVAYADAQLAASPAADDVLAAAVRLKAAAVLIDTFDKQAGDLLTHWSVDHLESFLGVAADVPMPVVLAGSLTLEHIERLLPLTPYLFAVRGAACRAGRESPLDLQRLRRLVETVHGWSHHGREGAGIDESAVQAVRGGHPLR